MSKVSTRQAAHFEKQVGKRIKNYREAIGMSQTTLGDKIGVSFQQVQKYERGSNRMSAYRMLQASRVLGVDIKELYGLKGK